ncbi:MAG: ATP-dependent DNA helicase RecQ [Bacteroidota bacterium]|nr:ATP-dependent DNA helicase RecQ [Bacteroidota bacterium]
MSPEVSKYREILTQYWGYHAFRELQEEIILSVAEGKDTLGLMPTGGGKSVTFQVYSLSCEGICLVVTPLIALMKDQVGGLLKRGIKALAIHSGMSMNEINIALDNAVWGDYKFLYVSPERLSSSHFQERLKMMHVNLIAVDEAHCISQWGYDFRPSYLKIAELRQMLPDIPVLALTATATLKVVDDIQMQLLFKEKNVLRKSFYRENLTYLVRQEENKVGYLLRTIKQSRGSGIVYVRSRKKARELAELLSQNGISADYYHAGLTPDSRHKRQEDWMSGKKRVIVATNAFGMGIDKPDVRFVIHLDIPDSLEAYFQEAGRAGRDEKKSAAVLLYSPSDSLKLNEFIEDKFPPAETIKRIYCALGNFFNLAVGTGNGKVFAFNMADFASAFHFQFVTIFNSLKILERCGYLELTEEIDNPSKVHFIIHRDELYKFQVANASFDAFVKLLLRSYTGLFTEYVKIDENVLAKRAKVQVTTIYKYLNRLKSLRVIDYLPQMTSPFVIYLKERVDERFLKISREHYLDRKQQYSEQIKAVTDYANNFTDCRSRQLLKYFGEERSIRCGNCDVCKSLDKKEDDKAEFRNMMNVTGEILCKGRKPLDEVIQLLSDDTDKALMFIRWMIDNHKLSLNEKNELERIDN